MKFTLPVIVSVLAASSGLAIQVDMYDQQNGSGGRQRMNVVSNKCTNIPSNFGNRMTSFTKEGNNQCTFYDKRDCKGQKRQFPRGRVMFCSIDTFSNKAQSMMCN